MRKYLSLGLLLASLVCLLSVPLMVQAQGEREQSREIEVVAKEPTLILVGKENILDSLKAVIDVVNDPKIVEVLNNAVEVIKTTPTDRKDPNEWFNYITGIVAALSALITLILAKGKAIYNILVKKKA